MPKRYVRGDRAFGRILKQLPAAATAELRTQLNTTGRTVLALQQRLARVKSGALRNALSMRVAPVRLSLKVGLLGKPLNRKLFYGWIVEWGRKASVVTVNRSNPNGGTTSYRLRVAPMAPRHFVYVPGLREQIYAPYRNIWDKALSRAASGATDD